MEEFDAEEEQAINFVIDISMTINEIIDDVCFEEAVLAHDNFFYFINYHRKL